MSKLEKMMAEMDAIPWKLWECERGRRWSSKYDDRCQEGQTCQFSGCLPDHVIHLKDTTFDPPYQWFRSEVSQP